MKLFYYPSMLRVLLCHNYSQYMLYFCHFKTKQKNAQCPTKHQFVHSWATTHEQKIISEHGAGKLWRNIPNFLESNKDDPGITFHWVLWINLQNEL